MSEDSLTGSGGYILGHSAQELARLNAQARLVDPITRRFFQDAGIGAGMRVLDVGSGAGDVALLAAELVGSSGTVVGVDRSPEAVTTAATRATGASLSNLSFLAGDPAQMVFEHPFDAVVGRYVLQFQADPAAMLRRLANHLRPGGRSSSMSWTGPAPAPFHLQRSSTIAADGCPRRSAGPAPRSTWARSCTRRSSMQDSRLHQCD